jgi:predicted acetyltransferase
MPLDVQLNAIAPEDYDGFFERFAVYHRELDRFDPDAASHNFEAYRSAILGDLGPDSGRELFWIEVDGARAGFVMVRTLPDWPDDSTNVAEITEFYIEQQFRRQGAGRAAIDILLANHRARGTRLVEAAILRDNAPAHAFWRALGFEVHSVRTTRAP